jgi:Arc/MetJ-type ribon-helix-helix transcriptional regulator
MFMPNIELPEGMYNAIEEIIKGDPALGYESVEEFVREATRDLILTF